MNPFGTEYPLLAAPMAGGPTTTRLVRAATDAGCFGFLAGGYQTADALAGQLTELSGVPFGVNLFCSAPSPISADDHRRYAAELAPDAQRLGVTLEPDRVVEDDDHFDDKVGLLLQRPVPFVSFTFGLPGADVVTALQHAGTTVFVTVTTVQESLAAKAVGADGVIAQGSSAGGHSGTHDPTREITDMPTAALTSSVITATGLPVVAAGGVDGPDAVRDLLAAGADAVAVGTMLLRTNESGASQTHRGALADPRFTETVITHAFTGRPARALRNAFYDDHAATAPVGYPAIHHLTRDLRRAAAAAGDAEHLHLWAGTGYRNAPTGSAAAVLKWLRPD